MNFFDLRLLPKNATVFILTGKRKVKLEVKHEKQALGIHVGNGLQAILDSNMAKELDSLRELLAQKHNEVFPYTILSSQQIAQLCVQKPNSFSQVITTTFCLQYFTLRDSSVTSPASPQKITTTMPPKITQLYLILINGSV